MSIRMAEMYRPEEFEKKWQDRWEREHVFQTDHTTAGERRYVLDMFPYPSAAGLHVGHPEGYTASDILTRYFRMRGMNVLHPMGWDAFGLPAENYALQTKTHPRDVTKRNIDHMRAQIKRLGFAYDWSREFATTDPAYYRWTQWIFLKLFERGLAYEADVAINWCPKDKTGLANEEVVDGKCDRCGTPVTKKKLRQWLLKITAYADRLLAGLDALDWPEPIKFLQRNWIGRSEGAEIVFTIAGFDAAVTVFTTRPDTLFGATYLVLAPEHPMVQELATPEQRKAVAEYCAVVANKSDIERQEVSREKAGVFTGSYTINPVNNEKIPIWTADYVLMGYGTGAIMAVPAHDDRDFAFAEQHGLPVREVIAPLFEKHSEQDTVRTDVETVRRRTIFGIVKHWSEDKFLGLEWHTFGWHSFIIGGIEDGEDPVAAARREIQEETGYKNLRFVRAVPGEVHSHHFAPHKGVNRYAEGQAYYFELENGERNDPARDEQALHRALWVSREHMREFLNLQNLIYVWDQFTKHTAYTGEGISINSGEFSNMRTEETRTRIVGMLEKSGKGKAAVQFKLRDWVFSRQRYWGEPIPIVHCPKCGTVPVPESDLPVLLPDVESYEPSGTGESPLATISDWVNTTCPNCQGPAKRETNTMPQWAGSSWYFLRYVDPKNTDALADFGTLKEWLPVDLYVGGAEHAVLHLLYARFWNMVLYDAGVVPVAEPFLKLKNQGIILGEDGVKMSKSRGNVIDPDTIITEYGADTMRLYEMFMGPFEDAKPWSMRGIAGIFRFLTKVWKLQEHVAEDAALPVATERLLHQTIDKVTNDIEQFHFNTAVSALMICANQFAADKTVQRSAWLTFLRLLAPFAPHISHELFSRAGEDTAFITTWPVSDAEKAAHDEVTMIVQVNGKLRSRLAVPKGSTQEIIEHAARADARVAPYLAAGVVAKVVFVPDRLINFVLR